MRHRLPISKSSRFSHGRASCVSQKSTDSSASPALINQAVSQIRTDYVLLLNNDTMVINPRWLIQMMGLARMPGVGSVGARLYFEDGTIQHAGIVHGYHEGLVGHAFRNAPPHDWGYMGFIRTAREYSAVTAACALMRRATYESVGGMDEHNFAVAYNDVDLSYRMVQAGLTCVYCADAELFHFEARHGPRRTIRRKFQRCGRIYGRCRTAGTIRTYRLRTRRSSPDQSGSLCANIARFGGLAGHAQPQFRRRAQPRFSTLPSGWCEGGCACHGAVAKRWPSLAKPTKRWGSPCASSRHPIWAAPKRTFSSAVAAHGNIS